MLTVMARSAAYKGESRIAADMLDNIETLPKCILLGDARGFHDTLVSMIYRWPQLTFILDTLDSGVAPDW